MNDSVQRYIAIGVGSGDEVLVKNAVKNSFVAFLTLGVILAICLLGVKDSVLNNILNLPSESEKEASIVYIASVATILILIMQTPYNALVLSYEKMSFYAYMMIFDMISKLLLALLLSEITGDKLIIYSILLTGVAVFNFLIYTLYCYLNFKNSLLGGRINGKNLKEISVFSFWNVFGNFSYVCRIQGINIAINAFFATTVNAAYALSITVLNAINSLTQSLITALRPQIFKSYSEHNKRRYDELVIFGSKYTFSLLYLIGSPIIIFSSEVMQLWLDSVPVYTSEFVQYVIVVALIDSLSFSIIAGIQATGKIKTYQVIVSFFIMINLPLSYLLFRQGFSVLSMFLPFITTSLINLGLRLYFISINSKFNYKRYIKRVILPCCLAAVISSTINFLIKEIFVINGVLALMFGCSLVFLSNVIIFYMIVTSSKEKKWLTESLKRKLQ